MPLYLSKCRMFHNYFKDYNKKKKKRRKEGEEERREEGKILLLGFRGLKMKKTMKICSHLLVKTTEKQQLTPM